MHWQGTTAEAAAEVGVVVLVAVTAKVVARVITGAGLQGDAGAPKEAGGDSSTAEVTVAVVVACVIRGGAVSGAAKVQTVLVMWPVALCWEVEGWAGERRRVEWPHPTPPLLISLVISWEETVATPHGAMFTCSPTVLLLSQL